MSDKPMKAYKVWWIGMDGTFVHFAATKASKASYSGYLLLSDTRRHVTITQMRCRRAPELDDLAALMTRDGQRILDVETYTDLPYWEPR